MSDLREELRQEMLEEAREEELKNKRMRDYDYFIDSASVLEVINQISILKNECNVYGHDIREVLDHILDSVL